MNPEMASPDRADEPEPDALLVETLADPTRGKERLPYVVGLFEADSRFTRLCAGWTCCVVATEIDDEEAIEYLVRRLSDRLESDHVSLELTTTLDYLSTIHSEQVERILEAMDEEKQEVPLPRVGNFTRSHYYNDTSGRDGVGRTTLATGPDGETPRTADTGERKRERAHDSEPDGEGTDSRGETDDSDDPRESDTEREDDGGPMAQQRTEVAGIADRSRFNKLYILASRERDRYADVYEALVGRGSTERAVALRLLRQPDDSGDHPDFEESVRRELGRWEAVHDSDHVLTVQDWGIEPRPWLITDFTGEALAESSRLPLERAVSDGLDLAAALAHLHRNDVVHGGLDPQNVVYPGEVLADDEQPPLLDNVGLLNAIRFYVDPSLCLDPRYAAPEYFDREYGRIDHATDIYQVGAVLYRLCTGQPPYSGAFEDVRTGVLDREPSPPSQVAEDVPGALDDVVAKAMAKQKLRRYETVEHFERELASIGGIDDG